jgi:hypothetical protein
LMSPRGVYVVEDINHSYLQEYGGGFRATSSFVEHCKELVDELNARYTFSLPESEFTRTTFSISFFDNIIVFEKGRSNTEMLYLPEA